ncbi:hypothetical protein [Aeromicrobium wangtongii]|uniref:Uncharacterized protein n=1 Tax=Aeromicrobium wangtongii TaxID=2969247 RepID=A0ABY5MEM7_9ACTN|nr:hypothetical protein [Aeromicrobium wangtongii]MCD9196781.1 hypothetical protein [Aeromicrobium wangtongii]UUP14291.1 hypothetical protein NQV15_02950 [Aeromicrobium wangtongii]
MWTWVDGAEDIVEDGGFAVGDAVAWPALTRDFDELLPQLPDGLEAEVTSAVDDGGDTEIAGTISRIVMLTGRRRMLAHEISATPAEHVQVLDMAGFLVHLDATGA